MDKIKQFFKRTPISSQDDSARASDRSDAAGEGSVKNHEKVYWTNDMANLLEGWGAGNTWHELLFLFAPLSGKVLDIACGTGQNIDDLKRFEALDVPGC